MDASKAALRAFPEAARIDAGHQLHRVQQGLEPDDWRSIPSVGSGVKEIRVHTGGEYRVFYVAALKTAIYVLHAFQKKTETTRKTDIQLGRKRYALAVRQDRNEQRKRVN